MAITIRPTPHLKDDQAKSFLDRVKEKESSRINFTEQKAKAKRILAKATENKGH